jgi:alpha-beta hydrolase superfamily lysophospholipase
VNPGVAYVSSTFAGTDGATLFERSWRPQTGDPKAVLVIVHGLKDHSAHYAVVAQKLVEKGYAVYSFDLRGHGQSDGERVHIDSFDQYLNDLDLFLTQVKQKEPGKPLFLFGHSMGGAIVTLYTINHKPDLRGLLLSGPALKPGSDISPTLISFTHVLGTVTPDLPVMDLANEGFSRDPAVVKGMYDDPLIEQGKGPAHTAAELLSALDTIGAHMEDVTVPLLIMHGSQDHITNPEGSKELYARAKSTDKTLKIYEGLVHDLLHEPEKDQVFADMSSWMDAHVSGSPAATPASTPATTPATTPAPATDTTPTPTPTPAPATPSASATP